MVRATAALTFMAMAGPALAGPNCTSEPKDKWLAESVMKSKIDGMGYKTAVFKTTAGNCYEIYGFDKSGARVEIYFHPVSGEVVEAHKKG